jgi:hypothetical protein
VTAADFDGDGIPDLAVSRNQFSMISIYRNDGSGQLTHAIDLPVGLAPNYLRGADFNRDGRTDLVVSNGGNQSVSVLFAQAGMGFSMVSFPAGHMPTSVYCLATVGVVSLACSPSLEPAGSSPRRWRT